MKIPEGWPTEEMLFAAREACDDMFQTDFIGAFKAAISAAPTPPAQENQWQQAVLNECMAIEGCYKESDPAGTVKCLIDWHVANERSSAQDDEPVAWYWAGQEPRVSVEKPYNVWRQEWKPLYTRSDNNKLRIAAEEAEKLISYWRGYAPPILDQDERRIIENLRAALEGK